MSNYILEVNERKVSGRNLIAYLKSLNSMDVCITPQKEKMNGLDEAMEDIKMGRVTTYENFEEYEIAMNKMLGYV
jgi:hypothetical protein